MSVLRHWMVYSDGGEPQVIHDEQTASERIAARETVFGPFVLELPQSRKAVDELGRLRGLVDAMLDGSGDDHYAAIRALRADRNARRGQEALAAQRTEETG